VKEARVRATNTSSTLMKDPRISFQPIICVADVDTRLTCSTYCAVCPYYVRERRIGERRACPRPTHDRRILGRL
jgi:hypothetical protein